MFQRISLAAVVALMLLIVSGATVRLTGSGLGCSDWPNCTRTGLVAPWQFHAWVEFGNRLINAVVTIASIGAFVAARRRRPRRSDLTWLSFGLVAGLVAEVALGEVVVYSHLDPTVVSVHFLLGLIFLGVAVVLHQRAALDDDRAGGEPMVGPLQVGLARLSLIALLVVVSLGTVVTSSGPHGGSPTAPRYHFGLHAMAQMHGTSVEVFLAVTLLMLWSLVRSGAPPEVIRRAEVMLVALVAQAAVGYTQYLSGDPVGVVAVHVAGASVLVVAALRFYFGLWAHPVPAPAPDAPTAVAEVVA
jgi:cytochrome c oxidase assembly protein subunit 15